MARTFNVVANEKTILCRFHGCRRFNSFCFPLFCGTSRRALGANGFISSGAVGKVSRFSIKSFRIERIAFSEREQLCSQFFFFCDGQIDIQKRRCS